ncbi:hypothetical protein JCM6882_004296 [Rhodosporidiobolus microsporus]
MLLAVPLWVALALRLARLARAAPADLNARSAAKVLADGSYYQSGALSSSLRWQASGVLTAGGCPAEAGIKASRRRCFTMSLSGSGDLQSTTKASASSSSSSKRSLDDLAAHWDDDLEAYGRAFPEAETAPYGAFGELVQKRQLVLNCSSGGGGGEPAPPSPRQRIELFTWPAARAGSTWRYEWKSRTSETSTSSKFFHVWQILRRDACGGPIITLDLKGGQAVINDPGRGCSNCVSVHASHWMSHTITHTLLITFGLSGSLHYTASVAAPLAAGVLPAKPLLEYKAQGDMGDKTSLKVGSYRAVVEGMEAVTSWVGDFSATKLS